MPRPEIITDVCLKGPDEYPGYERWNYCMSGMPYHPIRVRKGASAEVVTQYLQEMQSGYEARENQARKDADHEEKQIRAEYDRHEKRMKAIKDKARQAKTDREKAREKAEDEIYDRLFPVAKGERSH